ncbi:high-affinity iron permease [Blastocladiella emersonii ATCC 22665]|nr:high-affinity iron permease [Blastocladiella emersonii ATCC 22665]
MSDTGIQKTFGVPDKEVETKFRSTGVFDVPAYFIFSREVLEMAVIIAVLVTFINRIMASNEKLRKQMVRQVYLGAIAGTLVSIALAVIFIILFQTLRVDIWGTETFEIIFEAVFKLLACALITIMAFTMIKVEYWQLKWERKLRVAAQEAMETMNKSKWTMFLLSFTVVLREGLETLVLLGGTSSSASAKSIILPAITGIITGCLIGWLVYKGGSTIALKVFVQVSIVFLLFIAAGLFMGGCHEIEELTGGEIVVLEIEDVEFDPDDGNVFFQIIGALFGWRSEWTVVTVVTYFLYWVVALPALYFYNRKQTRLAEALAREEGQSGSTIAGDDDETKRIV